MPGWNNKTKGPIGYMITPSASSSTCRPATAVTHASRGDSWGWVPRSLFWREDLDGDGDGERGLDCLTFALVLSKAHRKGCRASCGGFPYW
ncbi:hypothetical protein Tco_0560264 [Tanacetum coccineum]